MVLRFAALSRVPVRADYVTFLLTTFLFLFGAAALFV